MRSHFDQGFNAKPGTVFLALDGTGNDQLSRTNAVRLYELIDNRATGKRLATYYAEGVGSDYRLIGAITGWGLGHDVRQAYTFLAETWRPHDDIVIAGFSRGAYTARVLAGLIAIAGIPNLSKLNKRQKKRVIRGIYDAYKTSRRTKNGQGEKIEEQNSRRLMAALAVPNANLRGPGGGVRIKALALWDTVEALGLPDRTPNPYEKLDHYFVSTCNVDYVFHALALDDNREHSFTPILVGGRTIREACPDWHPHVEEVWFSGAHADVGGSYSPGGWIDGHLPGVSMNWMLSRLRWLDLARMDDRVVADPLGPIHDAKANNVAYKGLTRSFRKPFKYVSKSNQYSEQRLIVHQSVRDRLSRLRVIEERRSRCEGGEKVSSRHPDLLCLGDQLRYGFVGQATAKGCATLAGDGYALKDDCFIFVGDDDKRPCPPSGVEWRHDVSAAPPRRAESVGDCLPSLPQQ